MNFLGGPVIKTSPSSAGGMSLVPVRGTKILQASWAKNQNIKYKLYSNKFNRDFLNGPHKKKILKKIKEPFISISNPILNYVAHALGCK